MSHALRTTLWIALPVLILGAAALYLVENPDSHSESSYTLAAVERGDLTLSVSATGALSPLVTVLVGSQVSGTIEKVHVDFNSQVRKGDVIAQIEPSLFEAKVAQEQANYDSTKADQGEFFTDWHVERAAPVCVLGHAAAFELFGLKNPDR